MDFRKLCRTFEAARGLQADFLHFKTMGKKLYAYALSRSRTSSMLAEFEKVPSEVDFCSVYLRYACKILRHLRWIRGDATTKITADGIELSVNGLHLRLKASYEDEDLSLRALLELEDTLMKTTQHIEVDRKKLLSICRASSIISDHISLQMVPEEGVMVVSTTGDKDSLSYKFSGDISCGEDVVDEEDLEAQKVLLNPELLEDALSNSILGKTVRVYVRSNMPAMISGNGVRFVIAPMVE